MGKGVVETVNRIQIYSHKYDEENKHTFHVGCPERRLPWPPDFHHPAHDQSRKVIYDFTNAAWPSPKSMTSAAPH